MHQVLSPGASGRGSQPPGRPFTGRDFLIIMAIAFGVVFAVNFTMAYLAIKSFNGLDVPSSYQAGREFSADLAAAEAQARRHWTVDARVARMVGTDGGATIVTDFHDRDGQAPKGLRVTARLEHPSDGYRDRSAVLTETTPGHFEGVLDKITDGGWTLVLVAERDGTMLFKSRNRVTLSP